MTEPFLVYFSSATENTKIFLEKLDIPSLRLPLYGKEEYPVVERPYILVVPTYGAGMGEAAVPPQVRKFLKDPNIRDLCVGLIGSGNINFGEKYAAAADVLSARLHVPVLYRFELRGAYSDVENIIEGIENHWETLLSSRGLS